MIGDNSIKQLLIVVCIFLMGCSSKNEELIQISLSTNGRKQDTTGAFAIELNKNLSVSYYGGSQSGLAGDYIGEIKSSDWDKFAKLIDYKQIKDTVLSESSFEDNYFDLSIKLRHKKYYIRGFYSNAPQNIKEICELVLSYKKKIEFEKTHENHVFGVKAYKVKQKSNENIHFTVPEVK